MGKPGRLSLVATPIGNRDDITRRALSVLAEADRVLCEDTRVTGALLAGYGITTPMGQYHEHNAARVRPGLVAALAAGAQFALVSDAGTPLVSDPGYKLVRDCIDAGIAVTAVPGASAVLTALCLAGLPTDRFLFAGFLPRTAGARDRAIAELAPVAATLVLFEAGQRLGETLAALAAGLGPRTAAVVREATKRFEEVRRGPLDQLAAAFAATPARGEVTLVIDGPAAVSAAADPAALDAVLAPLSQALGTRRAAAALAALTGADRKALYRRAVELA